MAKNIEYEADGCKNIFLSDSPDIGRNFMRLWLQVICEREGGLIKKKDRQTVSLEL